MRKRRNSIGTQSSYTHFNSELGVHTWKETDKFSEFRVENKLFCFGIDLGHHPMIKTYEYNGGEKLHLFSGVWVWRKPINIACYTGTLTTCKRLCGYEAKISCLSDIEDPILVAIRTRKIDIVKYLLTLGVDINVFTKQRSPLSHACWVAACPHDDDERPYEIVSLLIDHGANVNEILSSNRPLWDHVLLYGNIKLVEILLKNGTDCTITDKKGNNVIDLFIWGYLIRKYNHEEVYSKSELKNFFL